METTIHELRDILKVYTQEELIDILEYEVNKNDINGVVENAIDDIDERISEYIETIKSI